MTSAGGFAKDPIKGNDRSGIVEGLAGVVLSRTPGVRLSYMKTLENAGSRQCIVGLMQWR